MNLYLLKSNIKRDHVGDGIINVDAITSIIAKKYFLEDRENPAYVIKIYMGVDCIKALYDSLEALKEALSEIFKASGQYDVHIKKMIDKFVPTNDCEGSEI